MTRPKRFRGMELLLLVGLCVACEGFEAASRLQTCVRWCKSDACVESCFVTYREMRKSFAKDGAH